LIQEVFGLPKVKGAIRSLVGEDPGYDHSFMYVVPGHHQKAQDWHGDSFIDTCEF
jgi:hypothetical protein